MPKPLTDGQIAEIMAEMVCCGVPVRFLFGGQSMNIQTGTLAPKGISVVHQQTYWNFGRSTARKVAKWTGARAVWSK